MRIKIFGIILGLFMLLQGCAQTQASKEQGAMIVWKSPAFRYADMGFITDNGERLEVEAYGSGSALTRLKISKNSVCMNQFQCVSKEKFNRQMLSAHYPEKILENIFRGQPIFGGRGLVKKRNGYRQKITSRGNYVIEYEVSDKQVIFQDDLNHIVIKIYRT